MKNNIKESHSNLYSSLAEIMNALENKRKVTSSQIKDAKQAIDVASEIEMKLLFTYKRPKFNYQNDRQA